MEQTEHFLELFERAIAKHTELVGREKALSNARKAGLGVSADGHIVSCIGHPMLVLLRLIKVFTNDGNINTISVCLPLIDEMERIQAMLEEPVAE